MYLILLFQMTKPNLIVTAPGIYGEVEAQFLKTLIWLL